MDHIDRRKSANDIQALFYENLKIGSANKSGDDSNQERWLRYAEQLQSKIDSQYWDAKTKFYYDTSIRRDGSKDPEYKA